MKRPTHTGGRLTQSRVQEHRLIESLYSTNTENERIDTAKGQREAAKSDKSEVIVFRQC